MYAENQAAVIGLMEMCSGIGLTIAPLLGTLLYDVGGFKFPFLVFGVLFFLLAVLVRFVIPYNVDVKKPIH